MAERFYVNSPLALGPATLEGAEAHHLASVRRLRPGDAVSLFNGDGREYQARVVAIAKRSVDLDVETIAAVERELAFSLEVAAPLPKGDRAQFLIEKLTELGVTAFVPLRCRRSVVHPGGTKLDKLERYVIEASKQCGRNALMRIGAVTDWTTYCAPHDPGESRWFAHPEQAGTTTLKHAGAGPLRIAVGPEGGFTDDEVELARQHGWQRVGLGPRTLRIETAALALAVRATL